MSRPAFIFIIFGFFLTGCTGLRTAFVTPNSSDKSTISQPKDAEPRFLEDISLSVENVPVKKETVKKADPVRNSRARQVSTTSRPRLGDGENIPLQAKYAELLNTPVYEIKNLRLFEFIDDWYGTPYRYGGTTKKGIDCSAFSQYLFTDVYGITLPRTAREQYNLTNRISRTELREGDLLFFNTRGGVSHVGVYLQNNKFVHASTSGGVMISDIFESYWVRRFIGVGRIRDEIMIAGGQ